MKTRSLLLLPLLLLLTFAGCKKDSFDKTKKTLNDFIGTWKGSISTFKDNKLMVEYGSVYIYRDANGSTVSGILFMKQTNVFHEFQFVDGTIYYKVVNNDPASSFCQNWSLGGYLVFTSDNEIEIRLSGNECGQVGNEFVNWTGTLRPAQVPADSVQYFSFGKTGNTWSYEIWMKNGDTCQLDKAITQTAATYNFSGTVTQNCGWPGSNQVFKWTVNPAEYLVELDSSMSNRPVSFPIDAKYGVTYRTYINKDTASVTLVDTSVVLPTAAGNFSCMKFRYSEPVYSDGIKVNRVSYIWLNNRFGLIRQEVSNPIDSTDVNYQIITSKNF